MISQKIYDELHGIEFAHAYFSEKYEGQTKEHKEATFCFAKELNDIEKIKKEKLQKIRTIEEIFIKQSDFAFRFANGIRKGKLKKLSYDKLSTIDKLYQERIERLDNLATAYFNIIENKFAPHPNYDKFMDYSLVVLDALELEIAIRNKKHKI